MNLNERRYDLDWLRVLAFYLLILFHTGMLFVPWDFHIKNNPTSEWFETWMAFLSQWRLPLLFVISGIGVTFAFSRRTAAKFAGERTKRLFLPLVFGMLFIIPPQIYVERIFKGQFTGNYFEFWKTVFNFVPYPEGGALSWHHLWYILYVFVFSLISIPLLKYLRGSNSCAIKEKLNNALKKAPSIIYLAVIPVFMVFAVLARKYPTTHALIGDWYYLSFCYIFFFFGIVIMNIDGFWDAIVKMRKVSLIIALVPALFLELFVWGPTFTIMNERTEFFFFFYGVLRSIVIVAFLLALFGYARVMLNKTNKFLRYANESVYPFYILHQSVELVIAYFIIQLDWGVMPKFFAVAIGTFVISYIIYELCIRRYNFMRMLFGLNPREKKDTKPALQNIKAEEAAS